MSVTIVTILIPCATLTPGFWAGFRVLLAELSRDFKEGEYEIFLLVPEGRLPSVSMRIPNVQIIPGPTLVLDRVLALDRRSITSPIIAYLTADDLWFPSKVDLLSFVDRKAKVGLGNFICVRPVNDRRVRVFQGLMQLSECMVQSSGRDRFNRFIGEAPATTWGFYDRDYFFSLYDMCSGLIGDIKDPQDWNIIEDCINLVNLTKETSFMTNTVCVRFFNSNYRARPAWRNSMECLDNLSKGPALRAVCDRLARFTSETDYSARDKLALSAQDALHALVAHTRGYSNGAGRKWRNWIDTEFFLGNEVDVGVVPNENSVNKYDVAFQLSRISRPVGTFPSWCWLSNKRLVDALYAVPKEVWAEAVVVS